MSFDQNEQSKGSIYTSNQQLSSISRNGKLWYIDEKQFRNDKYVPHQTPRNVNRHDWHNAYLPQLIDMHNIVINTINERYPKNNIKWETNDKIFNNLSRLLYNCSSNYISEYLDTEWNENESKEWNTKSKDGKSETTIDKSIGFHLL